MRFPSRLTLQPVSYTHLDVYKRQDLKDAASISIIGAADGPTSIYVANYFKSNYQGPIMVAAYSYMALVPIVQPPVIRAITTKKERMIRMPYQPSSVSKGTKIIFPIFVTIVAGTIAPKSAELIGFLMFGNLVRECGVLDSLSASAQKEDVYKRQEVCNAVLS